MLLADVLNFVIDDGIESLRQQCSAPHHKMRFEGGRAGFEACRGVEPVDMVELLDLARARRVAAKEANAEDYWWHRYYEAQIEYVASVMSAGLVQHGLPPIVTVTAQSMIRYAEIVGVQSE